MLAKRIIPCLDVKKGRVVKGAHFVNLRDAGDLVEAASYYSREGADELVFLDIIASVENRETQKDWVKKVAEEVFIPLTVGGGIKTIEDITGLLRMGADKISLNTSAVETPELVRKSAERFGSQCIVVAVDAKQIQNPNSEFRIPKWEVYTYGGRRPTGIDVLEWVKKAELLGAGEILLTSMDTDGTKEGYDMDLTAAVSRAVGIPVIASGGAGSLEHLYLALSEGRADAVLAASIFHYREYTIRQAKEYVREKGVPVRL